MPLTARVKKRKRRKYYIGEVRQKRDNPNQSVTMPRRDLIMQCTSEELSDCQRKHVTDANLAYYKAIKKANDLVASLIASGEWTPPTDALAKLTAHAQQPSSRPPPHVEVEVIDDDDDDDSRDVDAPPSPPVPVLTLAPLPRAERPLIDDAMFAGSNLTSEIPPPQKISLHRSAAGDSSRVTTAPAASTPASRAPAASTPASRAPAASTPASRAPAASTPASRDPAASTPANRAPAASTPAIRAPAVSTPANRAPATSTPASRAPTVSTPVSRASAASTPASRALVASTPAIRVPMVAIASLVSSASTGMPKTAAADPAAVGSSVTTSATLSAASAPTISTIANHLPSTPALSTSTPATRASSPDIITIPTTAASSIAITNTTNSSGSGSRPTPTATRTGTKQPHVPDDMQARAFPALHITVRTPHSLTPASKSQYPARRSMLDQRVKKVLLHTASQFTEWLIQTRLVRASQLCPAHPVTWSGQPRQLRLGMFTDSDKLAHSGGYVWVKTCCRPKFLSVYHGSLFDSAKLHDANTQAVTIMKLMYHWACQTPLNNVTHWLKLRPPIIDEVYGLLRAVCMLKVEEHAPRLGSVGGRVQVGLVSLGTSAMDGHNKNVKVEVLGVKDEVSGEIRLVGFEPRIKNRIRAVVGAVQDWVTPECSVLLDHSISPLPFRPHFKRVENAPASSKDTPGNIMHYLRRSMPRMFQQSALVYMKPAAICQFVAEITWREKYGRDPNAAFSNLIAHLGSITQQNQGCLVDMMKKVLQSPSMDLKRRPRKQTLSARPDCEPQFSTTPPSSEPQSTAPNMPPLPDKGPKQPQKIAPKPAAGTQPAPQTTPPPPPPPPPPIKAQVQPQAPAMARKRKLSRDGGVTGSEPGDTVDQALSDGTCSETSAPPSIGTDGGGAGSGGVGAEQRPRQGRKRQSLASRSRRKNKQRPTPPTDLQRGSFFKLAGLESVKVPNLAGMRCWECKLPLSHPRHLTGVYACKRCRYATCCEKIYPVHRRVFHSPGVLPVFSTGQPTILDAPLYCSCGYGTTSGNRLALHMSGCDCRTARPTPQPGADAVPIKTEISAGGSSPTKDTVRVRQDIVKHDDSLDLEAVKEDISMEMEVAADGLTAELSPVATVNDESDAIHMEVL